MKVQFNTDKTISGGENKQNYFASLIEDRLLRFQSHISRIEVYLSDDNGRREGYHDFHCVLEARIEGRSPVAVTCHADTTKRAITGAIDKVKSSMDTIFGRLHSNDH